MSKRRGGGGGGEEGANWMDTYGDMVTLILTFFILLYSMSSMDKEKYQYIAQAFSAKGEVINAVADEEHKVLNPDGNLVEDAQLNAGEVPETFDQLYQYIQQTIKDAGLQDSVSVDKTKMGVYMRFKDNVFFNPDKSVLLDEGKVILEAIAPGLKNVDSFIMGIKVNGHTAQADGSLVNDRDLSTARANSVIKYIETLEIVDPSKLNACGYGKYRPIADNATEEGRRENRRVEIIFARNDADYSDPAVMEELVQMEFGGNAIGIPTLDNNATTLPPLPATTDAAATPPAGGANTDTVTPPTQTTAPPA